MGTDKRELYRLRLRYLLLTAALFGIELLIGAFAQDRFLRPYVGDMLVVVLIYSFLRIFIPRGRESLIFFVFLFAALVEILQYFHLPRLLGLEHCRLAVIVLGSTFDLKDLGCYFLGCAGVWGWERRRKDMPD